VGSGLEASYDALRKTQLQERKNPALAPLDASFYADYRALLAKLQEKFQRGGVEEGKELANTESVLRDVMEAREQKIVFKALRDSRAGAVKPEGLAAEEKQLYLSIVEIINDFESRAANHSKALKEVADEEKPANRKAKFLKDLPAIAWRDGSTQGPFKAGDVLELGREFAEFLKEKQVVEFV
jgi:DNA replication initiation complex subunit (GINS family)